MSAKINADIVVENALIVTMDADLTVLNNGSIVILNDRIIAIGNAVDLNEKYTAKEKIDAAGKLIIPGLINTHTHASMTVFRGVADDITLQSWLYDYVFPLEKEFVNAETVRIGAQLAIAEMLHSGTTTFNDMYFYEDEVAKLCKTIGIRAVLSESAIDFPCPNSTSPEKSLEYSEMLINKYKGDSLVTIGVAAHSPYSCSDEVIKNAKALADKYRVPFNIHIAETKWEFENIQNSRKQTPVQMLDSLNVLSKNTIGAHCVHLTKADIEIMSKRGVNVAHNPQCNMKLSSGAAPAFELLNNNVNVGIGTDGVVSNNNLDMFEEMNTTALLHKFVNNDPTVLDAKTIIQMATINGAKVLGLEKEIGSLEVGKRADLIIIDLNSAHLQPIYNIYSQIVYSMKGSDVESVIINGKLIMKDHKILTIDEQKIFNELKTFSEKLRKSTSLKLTN